MKVIFFVLAGLLAIFNPVVAKECHANPVEIYDEWITMETSCINSTRLQIQAEVRASVQYLAMAAHFSRDTINRPGFAKMFFEAASEEREHAMKLIEYLLMRGELREDVTKLIEIRPPSTRKWNSGIHALEDALKLEKSVTDSIRHVIAVCEGGQNDYHLADYLTGEFLEEQYKGQRDLAGKASTLKKMMQTHEGLGEFLFDKKLMGMDI